MLTFSLEMLPVLEVNLLRKSDMRSFYPRTYSLEGVANFRDLGGVPCEGGFTKYGLFYRSSVLNKATKADIDLLYSLGISKILDLRYPEESGKDRDNVASILVENISLMGDISLEELTVKGNVCGTKTLYQGLYKKILDRCQTEICNVLKTLIYSEAPILFHCAAGKDRTGLIAAFLASIVGVSENNIVADYMISEVLVRGFTSDISGSNYHNMDKVFSYLKSRYGGVIQYLKLVGLSNDDFMHLKNKFIQPF